VVSFTPRPLYRRYPLDSRLSGPQGQSERSGEVKKSHHCLCRESNPGHAARSLFTILTELLRVFRTEIGGKVRSGRIWLRTGTSGRLF
jgi:hypothetical protein